ncbi:MAG: hypothetical protein WCO04_03715, partial [Pseudomonadota bacterium]
GNFYMYSSFVVFKNCAPRKKKQVWSERYRNIALRLIASGDMAPAGLAAIELAKKLGTWEPIKPTARPPGRRAAKR